MTELLTQLEALTSRLAQIKLKLDQGQRSRQIRELEASATHADFWSNPQDAKSVMKRLAELQSEGTTIADLESQLHDLAGLAELMPDSDASLQKEVTKIDHALGKLEIKTFLSGQYAASNAIMSIHAG